MELDSIIWLLIFGSAVYASFILRHQEVYGQNPKGYLAVAVLSLLAYLLSPQSSAYIALGAWIWLIVVGQKVFLWRAAARTPAQYRLRNWLVFFFRPFDFDRSFSKRALSMEDLKTEEGLQSLEKQALLDNEIGLFSRGLLAFINGDFQAYLDWFEQHPERKKLARSGDLLAGYFLALGETGQIQRLYSDYETQILNLTHPESINFVGKTRLFILAHLGRDAEILRIGKEGFSLGTEESTERYQFWYATALQRAGQTAEAAEIFTSILPKSSLLYRSVIKRRLMNPLPAVSEQLQDFGTQSLVNRLLILPPNQTGLDRRSYQLTVTSGLIAVLLFVYLLELPGAPLDSEKLLELGGMLVPADEIAGEWWRPITAAFLHFGWLHVGMNCLALAAIGTHVEKLYGWWKYLISYLICAVGAIALAPLVMTLEPYEHSVLIGASGGVMGMVAMLAVQLAVMVFGHKNAGARRMLTTLVVIICVQFYVDGLSKEISSEAHLLGFGLGIACGVFWNLLGSLLLKIFRYRLSSIL